MGKLTVTCEWDEEASVWYVSETNVPGLTAEAATIEEIVAILADRITEMIRLNMPDQVRREKRVRIPFDVNAKRHQNFELACA